MSEAILTSDVINKVVTQVVEQTVNHTEKRYLKLQEAPKYANVSDETFSAWRKQGLIPITVIGGVKRVDRYDIDKLYLKNKFGEI